MYGAVDDERLCLVGEWRRVNGSGINHPAKGWFAASALPDQGANLHYKRDNLVQQAAAVGPQTKGSEPKGDGFVF